ncbi:aspartic peptidase domain-containing protein [Mycena galericulata]|nr:aspartic peptidase domain-containing protein [Mycena galericulata]
MRPRIGQGKGRAPDIPFPVPRTPRSLLERDSEGSGGSDGIWVPGSSPQNLSLQVDTGSCGLGTWLMLPHWIASSSCSSSACGQAPRYDPSTAVPTNLGFAIQYLVWKCFGSHSWDTVTIGSYSIDNQALEFSGVLGLALPANSIIAEEIPPQLGDTPDGAVWESNLFSVTPVSSAPSARFLSIALERPGSSTVPSVLGIGRHPATLVPDPSLVAYDELYEPGNLGPLYWKAAVQGITVYTNSSRMPIQLGRGVSGVFPSTVLDTGIPVILTTKVVADAIYGAIGITAASDNMYYLPCTMPLNMTVSLDDRAEIALHPLDLSTPPPSTSSDPNSCIGLIQTSADATLSKPSVIGDMIFGVPFLRNVYTVLAYDIPDENGTFPVPSTNDTTIRPRLGLMGLTNPTIALEEFHRVRVLNQPLGDAGNVTSSPSGPRKQSVGIDVLIGLGSFVALCVLLFGLRWLLVRRSLQRGADDNLSARDAKSSLGGYQLARRNGGGDPDDGLPSENELRTRRSLHTISTDRTQIEPIPEDGFIKDGSAKEPLQQEPPHELLPVSPRDHSPLVPEHSPERARHGRVLSVNLPLLPDAGVEEENPTSMAGVGTARHSTHLGSLRMSASPNLPHRMSMGLNLSPSPSPDS